MCFVLFCTMYRKKRIIIVMYKFPPTNNVCFYGSTFIKSLRKLACTPKVSQKLSGYILDSEHSFLLFTLHHIGRVLPCCPAYLPDDGEEDEDEHGKEDGGVDPPIDRGLLGILDEPLMHEVVTYGEGD